MSETRERNPGFGKFWLITVAVVSGLWGAFGGMIVPHDPDSGLSRAIHGGIGAALAIYAGRFVARRVSRRLDAAGQGDLAKPTDPTGVQR